MGYIACAVFEERVLHFGEGPTTEKALIDFSEGGEFSEYCNHYEIPVGEMVTVKVFKAVYRNDPDADSEEFEDGWQWVLGDEVTSINLEAVL